MKALWRDFVGDEAGVILSAELIIILTIAVLGMVVGLSNVQQGVLGEFNDLTMAFQSLNQSYGTPSYRGCLKNWGRTSWMSGSSFFDVYDGCIGSGFTSTYQGGEIVGNTSGYYLPSQQNTQVVDETYIVPNNGACPPAAGQMAPAATNPTPVPMPTQLPVPLPANGGCSTCP